MVSRSSTVLTEHLGVGGRSSSRSSPRRSRHIGRRRRHRARGAGRAAMPRRGSSGSAAATCAITHARRPPAGRSIRAGSHPVGQVDYLRMAHGSATGGHPTGRHRGGPALPSPTVYPVAVRVMGLNPHIGREAAILEVLGAGTGRGRGAYRPVARADGRAERHARPGHHLRLDPYGPGLAGATFIERPSADRRRCRPPRGRARPDRAPRRRDGRHRDRLRAHGQHLKRGILLYGPPGTGKTHTVRYLLSATPGTTAVLLSGGALQHIHAAAKVARAHQPAIVVLEDVDLVAEDRSLTMGPQPLLFEVLDALDGLDADADVAFLLTTNRVEDLEVALAQRPGGSTWPPRSRCRIARADARCSGSTAGTSSRTRRCPLPRSGRRARRPPSPRSSSAGPCWPRPSRRRRRGTGTSPLPWTSCSPTPSS